MQAPTKNRRSLIIASIIGVVVLVLVGGGLLVGLVLNNQNQDTRNQASTGTGTATVSISPATKTLNTGESSTFSVAFNPQGIAVSGITVRLQYPYSGSTPQLAAATPVPVITQTNQNWSCPITTATPAAGVVTIDVACLYLATSGYVSQAETPLFTVSLTAGDTPTSSPITISFEPTNTVITRKDNGQDEAAIPTSTSTVSIVGAAATATPTPSPSATPTPTATPTPSAGPNPTNSPTPTPTPGVGSCNTTCLANRDCQTGLLCVSGRCRDTRCSNDTTCGCADYNVASQSGTSELPTSGSVTPTLFMLLMGSLLIISSGTLLFAQVRKE